MAASEPASSYKVKERLKSAAARLIHIRTAFGASAEYVGAIRNGFIRAPDVARALKLSGSDGEESKKRIILEGEFERSDFA